ncbi:MAG: hypothetical protein ACC618_04605 [Patescibacteria group bacterium]
MFTLRPSTEGIRKWVISSRAYILWYSLRESHLLEICRHVALNPVWVGAVKQPEEWEWSSYRGMPGLDKIHPCYTTDWILRQFGQRGECPGVDTVSSSKTALEWRRYGLGLKVKHSLVEMILLKDSENT